MGEIVIGEPNLDQVFPENGKDDGNRSKVQALASELACNGGNGRKAVENRPENEFSGVNGVYDGENERKTDENRAENEFSGGDRSELPIETTADEIAVKDQENGENGNGEKGSENGEVPVPVKSNGSLNEEEEELAGNGKIDGETIAGDSREEEKFIGPHLCLPQPETPPAIKRSVSEHSPPDNPGSIGKFIRDRSNSFSTAIIKRISSLKENDQTNDKKVSNNITEINLTGLKVIVQFKPDDQLDFKGRISFFSRSNCRDCSAVRSFFRQKRLKFTEINVDVYPLREKELIERTGSASVPQIFFNEKLFGGLVALNSLRNSGQFEQRLKELTANRCPAKAPAAPVYGFDDPDDEKQDGLVGIVRVLRQRLPIQDRLMKMKIVKNCFSGSEAVEVLIHHMDCGRKKATEMGKELATKHFIHHVFQENEFEDGNHFYRFLEHEPCIPKCYNFRGATNDDEPKPAALVGQKLTKIMSAILEAYASDDRRHVDYVRIGKSEEFRRYSNLVQDLQRVNILSLSAEEKLAFFLNLYNAMVIHAVIRIGHAEGGIERRSFHGEFQYIIGGYPYSLSSIKNGILRCNRRQPYSLAKPFGTGDKRLEVALPKVNQLIHFGLCNGTRSSPTVHFFSAEGIEAELRFAAREFFLRDGMNVDLEKRTVYLTRIIKWYSADFGQEKDILNWIMNHLDATKSGLLTHLLNDGGPVNIVYQNYDWSLNS